MKRYQHLPAKSLCLLALLACLAAPGAYADDLADVNQLLRAGKHAEALARADQFLATRPRDPQMRFLKGVIQTESGRTADAIATFTKLTEDFPELPEPYNNLAVLYGAQGQFDKARAALEMAIRTNPSYATAHENLGDVYAKLASQAYARALQLDGSNAAVQPKLALIREIFAPGAKGQRPTLPVVAAPPAVPSPSAPPAVAAATTPAKSASSPAPAADGDATRQVEAAIRDWAAAWSARDMQAYLAAYGRDFQTPGAMDRSAWEEERRQRILGKSSISVRVSDLTISFSGGRAIARFRQAYSADNLNINSRKTLELVRSGDRWVIVRETTGG